MARKKPTAEDYEERQERAERLKQFMEKEKYTEVRLADKVKISRRTIQMIKAARTTPTPDIRHKLDALLAGTNA